MEPDVGEVLDVRHQGVDEGVEFVLNMSISFENFRHFVPAQLGYIDCSIHRMAVACLRFGVRSHLAPVELRTDFLRPPKFDLFLLIFTKFSSLIDRSEKYLERNENAPSLIDAATIIMDYGAGRATGGLIHWFLRALFQVNF